MDHHFLQYRTFLGSMQSVFIPDKTIPDFTIKTNGKKKSEQFSSETRGVLEVRAQGTLV